MRIIKFLKKNKDLRTFPYPQFMYSSVSAILSVMFSLALTDESAKRVMRNIARSIILLFSKIFFLQKNV